MSPVRTTAVSALAPNTLCSTEGKHGGLPLHDGGSMQWRNIQDDGKSPSGDRLALRILLRNRVQRPDQHRECKDDREYPDELPSAHLLVVDEPHQRRKDDVDQN